MTEVFISYSHEDTKMIAKLATCLTNAGISVWWDTALSAGADFSEQIEQKLLNADVIVVAWSRNSITSHWVADEASVGLKKGNLLPIILDDSLPRIGFRQIQSISFNRWGGSVKAREFKELANSIEHHCARRASERSAESAELFSGLQTRVPAPISDALTKLDTNADLINLDSFHSRPTSSGRLVGRQRESFVALKAIEAASAGHGSYLLVGGEPGVGKTRLGEEAMALAEARGLLPLIGHAYEQETFPYILIIEILEQIFRTVPADAFRTLIGESAPEIALLMPEILKSFPDIPASMDLPPNRKQHYIFNSITDFFSRLGRLHPLLIFLDDIHWADETSLLFFDHLGKRISHLPIFVLSSYRTVDIEQNNAFKRLLSGLSRNPNVARIELQRLTHQETAELLSELGGSKPPSKLTEFVFTESEGNAFFVRSLCESLLQRAEVLDEFGDWNTEFHLSGSVVPENLTLLINQRMESLSAIAQDIINIAAVLGRRFDVNALQAASNQPKDIFVTCVEELQAAKLLTLTKTRPAAHYEFVHALVQQSLVAGISPLRLEQLHARLAEILEDMYGGNERYAGVIAGHLYLAGTDVDKDKTIQYLRRASNYASRSAAFSESIDYLNKILRILPRRDVSGRADILMQTGSLKSGSDIQKSEIDLLEALRLNRDLGRVEKAAEIVARLSYNYFFDAQIEKSFAICEDGLQTLSGSNSLARCLLLSALGFANASSGNISKSSQLNQEAANLAEKSTNPELLADVLRNRAVIGYLSFSGDNIVRDASRAIELNRAGHRPWDLLGNLWCLQLGLGLTGQFEEARKNGSEARALAVKSGDLYAEAAIELGASIYLFAEGDFEAALTSVKLAVQKTGEIGAPWNGHFYGVLAYMQFVCGDWTEAQTTYEKSRENLVNGTCWDYGDLSHSLIETAYIRPSEFESIWSSLKKHLPSSGTGVEPAGRLQVLLAGVESLTVLERYSEAGKLYPLVIQCLREGQFVLQFHTGLLEKTAGIAAMAVGDYAKSELHFDTAMRQAEDLPYISEQGEVRRWYALMLLKRNAAGDSMTAKHYLSKAISIFKKHGMNKHDEMTEALMAKSMGSK